MEHTHGLGKLCLTWNSLREKMAFPKLFRRCWKTDAEDEWVSEEERLLGQNGRKWSKSETAEIGGHSRPRPETRGQPVQARSLDNDKFDDFRNLIDFCQEPHSEHPKRSEICAESGDKPSHSPGHCCDVLLQGDITDADGAEG